MTWNLWWRFGPWWPRQAAIAATLAEADADLIGLQEVWAEEDGARQAVVLGERLGYHVVESELRYRDGVALCNAVLSRWPVRRHESRPLPGADGRPGHRSALWAEVAAPFGPVSFFTTHLEHRFDASAERVLQVEALAEFVAERRGDPATSYPAIVTGDLNAAPSSDEIRRLTGRSAPPVPGLVFIDAWEAGADPGDDGFTWSASNPHLADAAWPNRRLDYVFVSWPHPKPHGNVARAWLGACEPVNDVCPSDHYAVLADLRTP